MKCFSVFQFELELPIDVKAGSVGTIFINLPLTSLYSSPTVVVIKDVYLLASPLAEQRAYDAKREAGVANAIKQKRLADIEAAALNAATEDDGKEMERVRGEKGEDWFCGCHCVGVVTNVVKIIIKCVAMVTDSGAMVANCVVMVTDCVAMVTDCGTKVTDCFNSFRSC